jgi:hypothetical protein
VLVGFDVNIQLCDNKECHNGSSNWQIHRSDSESFPNGPRNDENDRWQEWKKLPVTMLKIAGWGTGLAFGGASQPRMLMFFWLFYNSEIVVNHGDVGLSWRGYS